MPGIGKDDIVPLDLIGDFQRFEEFVQNGLHRFVIGMNRNRFLQIMEFVVVIKAVFGPVFDGIHDFAQRPFLHVQRKMPL